MTWTKNSVVDEAIPPSFCPTSRSSTKLQAHHLEVLALVHFLDAIVGFLRCGSVTRQNPYTAWKSDLAVTTAELPICGRWRPRGRSPDDVWLMHEALLGQIVHRKSPGQSRSAMRHFAGQSTVFRPRSFLIAN
jgi:hypothetical protein